MGLSEIFFVSLLTILGTHSPTSRLLRCRACTYLLPSSRHARRKATVSGPGKLSFAAPRTFPNRAGVIARCRTWTVTAISTLSPTEGRRRAWVRVGSFVSRLQLGDETGSFEAPKPYLSGLGLPSDLTLGYFNRDGAPDLAVANDLLGNWEETATLPCSSEKEMGLSLGRWSIPPTPELGGSP